MYMRILSSAFVRRKYNQPITTQTQRATYWRIIGLQLR